MKNFETIVKEICGKTRTKIPKVVPYKLRTYTAWCTYNRISYHPIKLSNRSYKYLLYIAAHEIGHIRCWGCWERNRPIAEYKAELFALKTIKKHYPKYFTLSFTKKIIKNPICKKYYKEPFKRALKEFKNEIL